MLDGTRNGGEPVSIGLQFLGAAGTVTGSKYLLSCAGRRILVDCGLFQGFKQLRLRNWAAPPFDPAAIDSVVLTHAHIDHSGYLPLLVKRGFNGPIYCSRASSDLCELLLPDSGHLQEEEAEYANRHGFSKHTPALPLYTVEDAQCCLTNFRPVDFDQELRLGEKLSARLLPNGHILGSALVTLQAGDTALVFSGDLGRPHDAIMKPPTPITQADYLVIESTYGDRLHDADDARAELRDIINRTAKRGGVIVIPAFAVERAQVVLFYLQQLKAAREIPDLPVYLNSPMAVDATRIYHDHIGEHRLSDSQYHAMCKGVEFVNSVEESKRLNTLGGPMIIISASGMATGGRVLHHLKAFAPDARNTVLFVGFQAGGTRGAAMVGGAKTVKIHGEYVPVNAEVACLDSLSAHADYEEILGWLRNFERPPKHTFITHGEPAAADALRRRMEEQLHWSCSVPDYLEGAELA